MVAHISMDDPHDAIAVSIFTEENRMKYTFLISRPNRIALPYVLRDLQVTHISFDQAMDKDWYAALSFLYNEFEAV